MDKSELQETKRFLQNVTGLEEIQFENFSIVVKSSKYLILDCDKNTLFSMETLSDLTVDMIEIINLVSSQNIFQSEPNNWVIDSSSEYPTWHSPVTESKACISPTNNFSLWTVTYPNEPKDIFYENFDTFTSALINLAYYLYEVDAYRVDYEVRVKEVACDEFQELPGIDRDFAESIVFVFNIYSYKQFLDSFSLLKDSISDSAIEDVKRIVTERAESDAEIDKSDELTEITTNLVLDNM